MQFFYTLDSSVVVLDGVGVGGLADAAVKGVILVGGSTAIIDTYHAVAVVVLVGMVAIAEHIAIVVVLYGSPPNGGVGIHVVVGVSGGRTIGSDSRH